MDTDPNNSDLTASERETLKAIYRATRAEPDAHTGVLADAPGVAPRTVTPPANTPAARGPVHPPRPGKKPPRPRSGRQKAVPRRRIDRRGTAIGRRRHPSPPHRRAVPV